MSYFSKFRLRAYALAAAYSAAVFAVIYIHGDTGDLRTIRTVEGFGLGGLAALYLVLIIGPLYKVFPNFYGKDIVPKMRSGFGDVALLFGVVHGSVAFWGLLGGPAGWVFLGNTYKQATLFSFSGLLVIAALFTASLGVLSQKVFTRFPWFGKIGYGAGVLLCAHVLLVGSHFRRTDSAVFVVFSLLTGLLALLLGRQVDMFVAKKFARQQFCGAVLLVVLATGLLFGRWYFSKQAAQSSGSMAGMDMSSMPGMNMSMPSTAGYTLSVQVPPVLSAGAQVPFAFKVFTSGTATLVTEFTPVHDKLAHLVIVNDKLNYYSHIHPDFKDGVFTITTSFPQDDSYRAYISVEPKGGSEQVFAYSFVVGKGGGGTPDLSVDGNAPKIISGITVKLSGSSLSAADIAAGKAKLVFHFTDSAGKPITDIYPYLAAFGHLVMINASSYSYLHVHPLVVPFGPDETGGPEVEFMIMGSVKPGVYKLFGQFNPHKELITVPFTIEVTE